MRVRLLGPVEIWAGGRQIDFDRRRERLLLALLLMEPSRFVSTDRLVDLFWPDALPPRPRRNLQVYASRLRAVLAGAEQSGVQILGESEGYRIIVPEDATTDLEDFDRLVSAARLTASLPERSELLRSALHLWRGRPLEDVASDEIRQRVCGGVLEARQAAFDLRIGTDLDLGRHEQVLGELSELSEEDPTNERLAAARMLALYRCGRRWDALDVYGATIAALSDELGLDPSGQLRDLHVAILRSDPSLDWTGGEPEAFVSGRSVVPEVPRELPADLTVLVGRDELLRQSRDRLIGDRPAIGVARTVCIHGASGMGKSAAAVRLGHLVSERYHDGQLFVRLMDADGVPTDPRTVVDRLLRSLGVPPDRIPEAAEERFALFRSWTANRAVLLVFDDAISAAQVRPLLPATSRCAVIVTSRRPLVGLEDASHLEMTPLSDQVSRDLLSDAAGPWSAAQETGDALDQIIHHCGGSPLALRIVGSRLAQDAYSDLGAVAAALADRSSRLDWLVADDLAVRRSLELSWRVCEPTAAVLLRRMTLIGSDELPPWAAAPLLGASELAARSVVGSLVQQGLVQRRSTSADWWYGMHSLIASYAAEKQAQADDPGDAAAVRRFLEAIVALAAIADERVDHGSTLCCDLRVDIPDCDLRAAKQEAGSGARWFDRAMPLLQTAVALAVRTGHPELAAVLALRANGHLAVRDDRERRAALLVAARDAVRAAGLVDLEARLEQALFGALAQSESELDELTHCGDRSLAAARRAGSLQLEVGALNQVGWVATHRCDFARAREAYQNAMDLIDRHPELEHARIRPLEGRAYLLIRTGSFDAAVPVMRDVCGMTSGSTRVRAIRLIDLSEALIETGRIAEAEGALREARAIVMRIGDELGLAYVGVLEARIAVHRGDPRGAGRLLDSAERVFDRRFDPVGRSMHRVADAERLHRLDGPAPARAVLVAGAREAVGRSHPLAGHICRLALERLEQRNAVAD